MLVDNLDGIMHYIFSGQPIGESGGCIKLHNFLDAFYETMNHMNIITSIIPEIPHSRGALNLYIVNSPTNICKLS